MGLSERLRAAEEQRLERRLQERQEQQERQTPGRIPGGTQPQDPYRPEDYGPSHEAWLRQYAPQVLCGDRWQAVRWQAVLDERSHPPEGLEHDAPDDALSMRQGVDTLGTGPLTGTLDGTVPEPDRDEANTLHLHVRVGPFVLASLVALAAQWDAALPDVLEEVLVRGCEVLREATQS